jgi:hypothetical protein
MSFIVVQNCIAWFLSAAFAVGAVVHIVGPFGLRAAYQRWGYPRGFRYVTASCHAATAALLPWPDFRIAGVIIGLGVSFAALITLVRSNEKLPGCIILAAALVATVL